jgi:uncharacterized membrane protein (DUF106 family)
MAGTEGCHQYLDTEEVNGLAEEKRMMKSLLKPDLVKIIFTFFLFAVASWLWRIIVTLTISDTFPVGFPLQFYLSWGPCPPGTNCSEFNALWLVVDLIFWYLVSAFLLCRFQKLPRSKPSGKNNME